MSARSPSAHCLSGKECSRNRLREGRPRRWWSAHAAAGPSRWHSAPRGDGDGLPISTEGQEVLRGPLNEASRRRSVELCGSAFLTVNGTVRRSKSRHCSQPCHHAARRCFGLCLGRNFPRLVDFGHLLCFSGGISFVQIPPSANTCGDGPLSRCFRSASVPHS
jgi:hypothetical protein